MEDDELAMEQERLKEEEERKKKVGDSDFPELFKEQDGS
jgi:hypothetical protein